MSVYAKGLILLMGLHFDNRLELGEIFVTMACCIVIGLLIAFSAKESSGEVNERMQRFNDRAVKYHACVKEKQPMVFTVTDELNLIELCNIISMRE